MSNSESTYFTQFVNEIQVGQWLWNLNGGHSILISDKDHEDLIKDFSRAYLNAHKVAAITTESGHKLAIATDVLIYAEQVDQEFVNRSSAAEKDDNSKS